MQGTYVFLFSEFDSSLTRNEVTVPRGEQRFHFLSWSKIRMSSPVPRLDPAQECSEAQSLPGDLTFTTYLAYHAFYEILHVKGDFWAIVLPTFALLCRIFEKLYILAALKLW